MTANALNAVGGLGSINILFFGEQRGINLKGAIKLNSTRIPLKNWERHFFCNCLWPNSTLLLNT